MFIFKDKYSKTKFAYTHTERNVHHTNKTDTSKVLQLFFVGRLVAIELPFIG